MHGGWQPYFKAVIISLLSLGFPLFVRMLSLTFSRGLTQNPIKSIQAEPHKFNSRFYLPALSINFIVLGFLVLSAGVAEVSKGEHSERSRIYGALFFFMVLFLTLIFLFTVKKGNLNWNVGVQNGQKNE